jgi:hypothetical protein
MKERIARGLAAIAVYAALALVVITASALAMGGGGSGWHDGRGVSISGACPNGGVKVYNDAYFDEGGGAGILCRPYDETTLAGVWGGIPGCPVDYDPVGLCNWSNKVSSVQVSNAGAATVCWALYQGTGYTTMRFHGLGAANLATFGEFDNDRIRSIRTGYVTDSWCTWGH